MPLKWNSKCSDDSYSNAKLQKLCLFCLIREEQMLRRITFKCKITKSFCFINTYASHKALCLIFFICVAAMHHSTTVDKNLKNNLQLMILTYL